MIICFCYLFFSCNQHPDGKSSTPPSRQKVKKELSLLERQLARNRFDTLNNLAWSLKGSGNIKQSSQYLNECLSIALSLNNDSLLARVYINLGGYFDDISEFQMEIEYCYKAFELFKRINHPYGCALAMNNMAWAYTQALDHKKGIEQALKGVEFAKGIVKTKDKAYLSSLLYNNLSIAYLEIGMPDSSLKFNELSYSTFKDVKVDNINHYAWIYAQFGSIYAFKNDFNKAEECFNEVIMIKDTFATADAAIYAYGRYCQLLNREKKYSQVISNGMDGISVARRSGYKRYFIEIADEVSTAFEKLNQIDSAYRYAKLASDLREEVFNTKKSIQLQNLSFSKDLKDKEIQFEIENAQVQEKLKGAQLLRNVFLFGFVLVMLFAVLFFTQRNKIRKGKERSDELLLNILPAEVAEELKSTGSTTAKHFENVTVMFTDFKNFTQIAEKLTPQELVNEIHTCFKTFDQIIEKYNIEKIKTIGDSYMCVGGLPVSNATHPRDVVMAALEIQQYMAEHSEQKSKAGQEIFEIRIGIHTGPVVAGIVGIKKFAYDIWGDTVNIASRMESSGEEGKVNISESTFEAVKGQFQCTYRGKISVKHKGEMDMYFAEPMQVSNA